MPVSLKIELCGGDVLNSGGKSDTFFGSDEEHKIWLSFSKNQINIFWL